MKKKDSKPDPPALESSASPLTCPRVILLGASNLTRGISTVVETSRVMLGGPLDVYAALGHGRSFGIDSRILVRTLPGILQCGIWEALNSPHPSGEEREVRASRNADDRTKTNTRRTNALTPALSQRERENHTFALITDIGNDVMYGVPPEEVAAWVRECARRLAKFNARLVITPPPIESVRTLKPWKYRVVKTAMFPTRRITFAQAMERSNELHERIVALANELNIIAVDLPGQWYGFDPIHIRRTIWPSAWRTILAPWQGESDSHPAHAEPSLSRWLHLRSRTPQSWRLLGMNRGRGQPCGQLSDGTRISLY